MKQTKYSLKTVLFGSLLAYVAITLTILWMLEINLLDNIYKNIKVNNIKMQGKYIENNINSENLRDMITKTSEENESYIILVSEDGSLKYAPDLVLGNAFRLPKEIVNGFISKLDELKEEQIIEINRDNFKNNIYKDTDLSQVNESNKKEQFNSEALRFELQERKEVLEDLKNNRYTRYQGTFGTNTLPNNIHFDSIMYIDSVTRTNGEKLILIITTNIEPVEATKNTLKLVLIYASLIMILLAIFLSFIFSSTLTSSIVKMTNSAKELSKGKYDVKFLPSKYKELDDLSDTLNYAATELSKVENLRREFLANVSHDLRTPLTMIIGYAEAIRDFPKDEVDENIQVVIDEARRLANLVNDLLDITKIESGFVELDNRNFNLTENINQIILRCNQMLDSKGYKIEFENKCKTKDVYVFADELRISQVIYNLIGNAITHSGENKKVKIVQSLVNSKVKVEVIDNGIGIPKDKIKDIWNRYYKVDKEHKRDQIGTGIGLHIIKQILENYNSEYGVVSEVGKGSNFYFTLELSKELSKNK